MKILHVHTAMNAGGVEAMVCGLCAEMVKEHEVHLLLVFEPEAGQSFLAKLPPEVKVHTLGKKGSGVSPKYLFKMASFIAQNSFDVVNFHGFFFYSMLAVYRNFKKIPMFYTIHSNAVMENSRWDRKILPIKKFAFRHGFLKAITISQDCDRSFRELYGVSPVLIPNGIKRPAKPSDDCIALVDSFRTSPRTRVIVHVGRLSKEKNQLNMCRAFTEIVQKGRDAVLLIVGPPDNEDILAEIEPYFGDRIKYLGLRSDAASIIACSDAMLLPSLWEGAPVVLLEAVAGRCVPICTPVGGIPDIVHDGENGILTTGTETGDIYAALDRFLSLDDAEVDRLKDNAAASFEPYEISHTAASYLAAYTEALRR